MVPNLQGFKFRVPAQIYPNRRRTDLHGITIDRSGSKHIEEERKQNTHLNDMAGIILAAAAAAAAAAALTGTF
jgi:hypothetical protein